MEQFLLNLLKVSLLGALVIAALLAVAGAGGIPAAAR